MLLNVGGVHAAVPWRTDLNSTVPPGTLAAPPRSGSRVFPGRKLPGRMGHDRVTVRNLEVVRVDPERNLLLVKVQFQEHVAGWLWCGRPDASPRRKEDPHANYTGI